MVDSGKPVVLELGVEFVMELLLFLYPYGADQMNLPHNFWLGLGCWVVGTAIFIRMFWIFPAWAHRFTKLEKALISFILVAIFVTAFYKPVITAYGKRNAEEAKAKPAPLDDKRANDTPPSPAPTNSPRVKPIPKAKPLKNPSVVEMAPLNPPRPTPSVQPTQPLMSQKCEPGADCAMSSGQQGGITANKVIIGNPNRRIPENLKPVILSFLTKNSGKIAMMTVDQGQNIQFAQDWHDILQTAGWDVKPLGTFFPEIPIQGVLILLPGTPLKAGEIEGLNLDMGTPVGELVKALQVTNVRFQFGRMQQPSDAISLRFGEN